MRVDHVITRKNGNNMIDKHVNSLIVVIISQCILIYKAFIHLKSKFLFVCDTMINLEEEVEERK